MNMRIYKFVFILIPILLLTLKTSAQDIMRLKNDKTIECVVTNVSDTIVEYKKYSNLDGPIYWIERSKVIGINYEHGEFVILNETSNSDSVIDNNIDTILPKASRFEKAIEIFGGVRPIYPIITYGIEVVSGYRFNKYLSLEIGIGIRYYHVSWNYKFIHDYFNIDNHHDAYQLMNKKSYDEMIIIPVHARAKINFPTNTIDSPFFLCDVGYEFSTDKNKDNNGFFFEPALGIDFRLKNAIKLYIAMGLNYYYYMFYIDDNISQYIYSKKDYINTVTLKIGVGF